MSLREQKIYEKIVAADKAAGLTPTPREDVYFFPTLADVKIARKWLDRDVVAPDDTWPLATALRLVAKRYAVPLRFLEIVRWLDKEEGLPVDRTTDAKADAADQAYVQADKRRLEEG